MWVIPELTPEYITRMEDLLDLYAKPLNHEQPMVCIDERPVQLRAEVRLPVETNPGKIKKRDSEYVRCGTANIFCAVEPKAGKHITKVTKRRKRLDFAKMLWERFTPHYTPKHGSWLNQAELEISLLSRESMGKDRFPNCWSLRGRVNAWIQRANQEQRKIDWKFTKSRAKKKFKY